MSDIDKSTLSEYEDNGDYNQVDIMVDVNNNPVTVSVWDGEEMVHQPTAALQLEHILWFAEGYSKAKEEYQ